MPAMPGSNAAPASPPVLVPVAVLTATRSLLQVDGAAAARRIAEDLVRSLGGRVVPANTTGPGVIPADVSFGHGEPVRRRGAAAQPRACAAGPAPQSVRAGRASGAGAERPLGQARGVRLHRRADRAAPTDACSIGPWDGSPTREWSFLIDLDHFKQVNDTHGHAAGDEVLRVFGKVLRETVRVRDLVGRYGGEEFLAVLGRSTLPDALLERLTAQWSAARPLPITFSAGLARSIGDPDATVALADEALYRAKDAGRNQWVWATARPTPTNEQPAHLRRAVPGRCRPGQTAAGGGPDTGSP
jgi:diguanylate cyclase (GGDEF)-like protein